MLDGQGFKLKVDEALGNVYNALVHASETHDFEVDFGEALVLEFDDPKAKFVISPNAPVRQIWISANSRSYKLDWNEARESFVWTETGQRFVDLMQALVSQHIGEEVTLEVS